MASKVFFIRASIPPAGETSPRAGKEGQKKISEKARKLFKAGGFANCFKKNDFTAVKVHVGEDGNTTYIKAPCIKGLVDELLALKTKPFITDTTTLYVGQRHNAIDHTILAAQHGFRADILGIPFIAPDGLFGTSETAIKINGEINKEVYIASEIARCQSILSVAHFTGHLATCFGATLKTLGMGCASKKGKMKQHAAVTLSITKKCTLCGLCYSHCPADAITLGKTMARIDQDKCIGCAQCLAVCRFGAVKCNWGEETEVLQKSIAEYALGVIKGKEDRSAFFNFILSVTDQCDCFGNSDKQKIVEDIGITASTDPVAIDKASLDLVENKTGKKFQQLLGNKKLNPLPQIEHAERLGLGTTDYELIEID